MTREQEFRRRWYEAHRDRFLANEQQYQQAKARSDNLTASAPEALGLLADLRRTGDLESFVARVWDTIANEEFREIFQPLLEELLQTSDDPQQLAVLLADSLAVPESNDHAVDKIRALVSRAASVSEGGQPDYANAPLLLSYFWAIVDRDHWPVMWSSACEFIETSTGERHPSYWVEQPDSEYRAFEDYRWFMDRIREISADFNEFEMVAEWWFETQPAFLDEVLVDRATFGKDEADETLDERETSAQALLTIADYWGKQLREQVSVALGFEVRTAKPHLWPNKNPRTDVWVDWRAENRGPRELGIRVWVNGQGVAVALRPPISKVSREAVASALTSADYPGCRVLGSANSLVGEDMGLVGKHANEFVYGRWFERDQLAGVDLAATVVEVATLLKPLYDKLLSLDTDHGDPRRPGDPLESIVEEYLAESGYPTSSDEEHKAKRQEFETLLARELPFEL